MLGSRDWLDRNNGLEQSLGEDLQAPHRFLPGDFEGDMPAARFVGTADCLAGGELVAHAADPADLFNGYPLECFIPVAPVQPPPPPQPRDFERASAYARCQTQRFWAHIIEYLYDGNEAGITQACNDFFTEPITIKYHPPLDNFPACVFIINPNWVCVAMDGTRNFQQLAMQGFDSLTGPEDMGIFSTVRLWYDAGTYIYRLMLSDGIRDARPVFLTGHSYGGAVALRLAANFRFWIANREVRYLTFGCPKIGDDRLQLLVAACSGAALRNHNDVVTAVPFDLATLGQLLPIFPGAGNFGMELWQRPPHSLTQDEAGNLIAGGSFELSLDTASDMLWRAINGQPFARVLGHGISEYIRRIELRCPGPGWPVDQQVINDLEIDYARWDTFDRVDQSPLGVPSSGGSAWSDLSGLSAVASNQAKSAAGTTLTALDGNGFNGTATVTIATQGGASGLVARVKDVQNYYAMLAVPGVGYALTRVFFGVTSTLVAATGPIPSNGDRLLLTFDESSLEMYVNGERIGGATDILIAATACGMVLDGLAARLDNFGLAVDMPIIIDAQGGDVNDSFGNDLGGYEAGEGGDLADQAGNDLSGLLVPEGGDDDDETSV